MEENEGVAFQARGGRDFPRGGSAPGPGPLRQQPGDRKLRRVTQKADATARPGGEGLSHTVPGVLVKDFRKKKKKVTLRHPVPQINLRRSKRYCEQARP